MLGVPRVITGSVGTTPKKVDLGKGSTIKLNVQNTHDTELLYISFDSTNWLTIFAAGGSFGEEMSVSKLFVKGAAADVTYEILVTT